MAARHRQPARVLVVGSGQAGQQVTVCLRERGFTGRIALVGEEDTLPYERPPLSKAYLEGTVREPDLWLRPAAFYTRRSVERITGEAVAVDRRARTVRLADGSVHGYDHLVLATGARPRTLPVPGAGLPGVHVLRTLRDAAALRGGLASARRPVVVGAGLIGLEFGAAAQNAGRTVTVVEALDRPLARVVSAHTAAHLTRLHRERGTTLLTGQRVTRFHAGHDGRVAAVELAGGRLLPADLVLVSTGVGPRTELAESAGLPVADGIVTDAHLLTADPHISAVGDCAAFPGPGPGGLLRRESVQNATGHARLVADRLTGNHRTYAEVPWFWSRQHGATLQVAGDGRGHDTFHVLGEDPESFSVLLFRRGTLVAVESLGRPRDHMAARRLLGEGVPLTPRQAAQPGFCLKEHPARAEAASRVPVPATV
ncbi:FAD-dependent oxidoreductase [Streptomyces albus]|uniref:NAD(P)/FAD-dependent oxidoreductase n=1 Tax=Streptomyces albus TaxID=1888 RepID=UPI0033EB8EA4